MEIPTIISDRMSAFYFELFLTAGCSICKANELFIVSGDKQEQETNNAKTHSNLQKT